MVYRLPEIAREVRVTLDCNNMSDRLLDTGDVDTLTVDEIIVSKILDAVRRVHSQAPIFLLESGHTFGDAIYWGDQGSGWVLLPDDFMRLIVFRMSDWSRAVMTAITPMDPEYQLQGSQYKGLRGTPQMPLCVLNIRPEGKVLEFYSCKTTNAQVSEAVYLPYPRVDTDGGIDICERCYNAVIYTAAALVLTTLGENDKATAMFELANTALN